MHLRMQKIYQHQPKSNNYNSNGHLMQYLYGANVVALLSGEVETVLQMRHLELPQMKAAVVGVTLLDFLIVDAIIALINGSKER